MATSGPAVTAMPPSTSSNPRGLPANPAQGLRRLPPPAANIPPMPPPPIPEKFSIMSTSSLSVSTPLSLTQVISLARDAMNKALRENENQAAEASGVSTELKPGITIDLSRQNIQELPDEVVDIIKNELERLALSHNKLASFPARFSECTSLRYLNVRNNYMKEFPLPLCDLKSLEILDLGRNKIRVLPPEIAKLASLKVLAVQKNRIEELPLCLADMVSLQVLKLDGNNITFPPKEVLQVPAVSPPNDGFLKEREVAEVTITANIKKYLKQRSQSMNGRESEAESAGDESSEGTETPRMPIKRVVSGRFPIRVNGNDVSDLRSPAMPRPIPPIPSRSHARGLSQQNAIRRPNVLPLTIGNPNERIRSNSETLSQASRAERPSERQRRMAQASRKANELGTLDETQANNRFSHYRGLSHGSSMTGQLSTTASSVISPNSAAEPLFPRPDYVRRLSILPEQRRESKVFDPIIESAKGILYAIFQIHPMVQLITRLVSDGATKRSSLEIVFYATNDHVEQLEQQIQNAEESGTYVSGESENIQRAVQTLIKAYSQVCSLLVENMDTTVENGDPRYIRTTMMLLYNSIMELRVTANSATVGYAGQTQSNGFRRPGWNDTIKPHSREASVTPTAGRPGSSSRTRPGAFVHNPSNLRVTTDAPVPYLNGSGRTAQITSATPRSGESFNSMDSRYANDFTAEERIFDKIFLSLQKSTDLVMRTLPGFNMQFNNGRRTAEAARAPEHVTQCWKGLIAKCTIAIKETETLKQRLSMIKLKEPGIRTDLYFWSLCKSFIDAWAEYGSRLKYSMDMIQLSSDIKVRLRPVQISIKETNQLIMSSPWAYLLRQAGSYPGAPTSASTSVFSSPSSTSVAPVQLPLTPQSAALGPAVQATVPSTPQSVAFANTFSGNVFERADALISLGGMSMSRTNTLNSSSGTSLGSYHTANSSIDERYGMSNSSSPNGNMAPPYRYNGGGKPAF